MYTVILLAAFFNMLGLLAIAHAIERYRGTILYKGTFMAEDDIDEWLDKPKKKPVARKKTTRKPKATTVKGSTGVINVPSFPNVTRIKVTPKQMADFRRTVTGTSSKKVYVKKKTAKR